MIAATMIDKEEKDAAVKLLVILEPGNIEKLKIGQPVVKQLRQFIPQLGIEVELLIGYTPDAQFVVDLMTKGADLAEALAEAQHRPEVYVPMDQAEYMEKAEQVINAQGKKGKLPTGLAGTNNSARQGSDMTPGEVTSTQVTPVTQTGDENSYRHVLRSDRFGRKGQPCAILRQVGSLAHIGFRDGFTAVVNRQCLRRAERSATNS